MSYKLTHAEDRSISILGTGLSIMCSTIATVPYCALIPIALYIEYTHWPFIVNKDTCSCHGTYTVVMYKYYEYVCIHLPYGEYPN